MAKRIENKNKGLKMVAKVMDGLAKDQNYWNSFIEEELLILTGYASNSQYYNRNTLEEYLREEIFSEVIDGTYYKKVCKVSNKSSLPTIVVSGIYKFKDTLKYDEIATFGATEWDDFANFGFKTKDGKVYMTHYRIDDSSFWKFLDRFLEIEEPEEEYTEFIPIRWLGAYNTNANGKGRCSFEEVLRYETSPKEREVAAQVFSSMEEAREVGYDTSAYICHDHLSRAKVGIVYQPGACREEYEQDVWSVNIGPYLIANRNEYDKAYTEEHYMGAEEGFFCLLSQLNVDWYLDRESTYDRTDLMKESTGEYSSAGDNYYVYNGAHNMDMLNTILCEAGYTYEEAICLIRMHKENDFKRTALRRSFGRDIKRAIGRLENALGSLYFLCRPRLWNSHSEGFVKVGEQPTAIAIRGKIRKETLRVIEKIAKEKDLSIIEL